MAISLSAAALARLYGFGHTLSPRQSWLQGAFIISIFIALAIPLALALKQIAWETVASRQAQEVLTAAFAADSRVSQISIEFEGDVLRVSGTVFTPAYRPDAEARIAEELARLLGREVEVHLEQVRVGAGASESAQLAAARAGSGERSADPVVQRVAAIAGADPNTVLVDRQRRIVRVRAAPLPGASLLTYRALEARAVASQSGWTVLLIPPRLPLPEIGGEPDEASAGVAAIAGPRSAWNRRCSSRARVPTRRSSHFATRAPTRWRATALPDRCGPAVAGRSRRRRQPLAPVLADNGDEDQQEGDEPDREHPAALLDGNAAQREDPPGRHQQQEGDPRTPEKESWVRCQNLKKNSPQAKKPKVTAPARKSDKDDASSSAQAPDEAIEQDADRPEREQQAHQPESIDGISKEIER